MTTWNCYLCGNQSLSTLRFPFFPTTFILSYDTLIVVYRPKIYHMCIVRGSAQVPSALASEPMQIIPIIMSPDRALVQNVDLQMRPALLSESQSIEAQVLCIALTRREAREATLPLHTSTNFV